MRKLISTFLLSLMLLVATSAQTIFDPATFAGTLPAGMEIVEIDGESYLQVVLDGWNSSLEIPAFTIGEDRGVAVSFKFLKSATDTITVMSQINATVQVIDTVNKVPASWDPGTMVPADLGLTQNPPSASFLRITGTCRTEMTAIHKVQFSAQEKYSWGPLTGDTIWVGKIYTIDPNALFDPATFEGTLPAGMEIVEEGGVSLLKVTVNEWNSALDIDDFGMGLNNFWTFQARLEPGTSGLTLAELNTFVGATYGSSQNFTVGAASSSTLTDYSGDAKANVTVTSLQFAAQHNSGSWEAVIGAIVYVGKITVSYKEVPPAPAPNTCDVIYYPYGSEYYITADGTVENEEFWSQINPVDVNRQALPANGTPAITDSYGSMKLAWDDIYLYVLIDAYDQTPIEIPAESETYWENDGAEFFIDIKNRRYVSQSRITAEQHQLRFNLGRVGADTAAINSPDLGDFPVEYGILASATGWKLEAALPWIGICESVFETLEEKETFVADSIKEGKKIAWEVSIINANAADTRNSIMNWANDTEADTAYESNEFYGEITLFGGPSGVKKNSIEKLRTYPNPANDVMYIMNNNISSYTISDITGKLVAEGIYYNNGINISNLQSGIYFLKANGTKNELFISKFVKE